MKENDFLEEEKIDTTPAENTLDDIASAIGSIVEEELAAEAAETAAAAEDPDIPDTVQETPEVIPQQTDEFYAVAAAVENALAEEFSQSVNLPEENAFETGSDSAQETTSEEDVSSDELAELADEEERFPDGAYLESDDDEFREMFESNDKDKRKEHKHDRPTHKGRPRRKSGSGLLGIPHLIATVIWLLIIIAIGVTLGRTLWVCAAEVLAFGRENKEVVVTITTDDTMEDVAAKLQEAGLIHYPELFLLYLDVTTDEGEESKITSGTFTLNTVYDYMALVTAMSPHSGSRNVIEDVLIPEGYSCRQIFALLEEKGICKASDLEEYAANGELSDYWFLEGVERGDKYCLEGFLFPDTYDFYENSTPRQALEKLLSGFNHRFSEELYAELPVLNARLSEMMRNNGCSEEYIAANQLDLRDLITIASLIEEETSNNSESYTIASVIYNRLTQDQAYERYLNIDAAIFYALGEHKEALTAEDLQIDSPYNTYIYPGLVPGPISNPGLASIKAALDPEDTPYYYYVFDPAIGSHVFSKTYEEHQAKDAEIKGR